MCRLLHDDGAWLMMAARADLVEAPDFDPNHTWRCARSSVGFIRFETISQGDSPGEG